MPLWVPAPCRFHREIEARALVVFWAHEHTAYFGHALLEGGEYMYPFPRVGVGRDSPSQERRLLV